MADIPDLSEDEWIELTERLTQYAACKLVRRTWRGVRVKAASIVVKGSEAADIAADALVLVIEGKRAWNQEAYPDFLQFLKGVVDSKVSAMVRSPENRRSRQPAPSPATGEPMTPDDYAADVPTPDKFVEDAEWGEKFRAAVAKEVGEDSISLGLFECLDAGYTKRADIAATLGVSVEDIYNAQKRLKKRVATVINRFEQGKKP